MCTYGDIRTGCGTGNFLATAQFLAATLHSGVMRCSRILLSLNSAWVYKGFILHLLFFQMSGRQSVQRIVTIVGLLVESKH